MGKSNKNSATDIVIACTLNCNSKCKMCNIWREKSSDELQPSDFLLLPKNARNINISGGEPFLRNDLPEILRNIKKKCKRVQITFSSNGFLTDKILKTAKKLKAIDENIKIVISIDGIGAKHDEIRGVPGAYVMAMTTVQKLLDERMRVGIAFTLSDDNWRDLKKVYQLSRELGIEMSLALVHSSDNFFSKENKIENKKEIAATLDWLIAKELKTISPKRWLRAYFAHGLKVFLENGFRSLPDYSGIKSIFINSRGDIFPSDIHSQKIGKLKKDFVLDNENIKKVNSWMICTARSAIKNHFFKVGLWILKNKTFYFFSHRSNIFYYQLGLLFMILNKIRYAFLGYHRPRPIAREDIKKNISYSLNVVDNFSKYLRKYLKKDFDFKNKSFLEIGPGSDFGTGLFVISRGASSYVGVDRFKLLNFNNNFYDELENSLDYEKKKNVKKIIANIKESINANKRGEINLSNFKYLNEAFENISGRITEKVDVIFSQAALEHVYNPDLVFEMIFENLCKGGVMIHEIDFAAHTTILRDFDPLNILRFSDKVYNALKFQGSPNRLRAEDYIEIARKKGFKDIKLYPLKVLPEKKLEKIRKSLDKKYAKKDTKNLKILSAILIAKI